MNLFMIQGPALISFSGGRTSAYMLWLILQAHGGTLPADVHVTFANTGKEREETLRFVFECASRWNVVVRWLERGPDGEMVEVGYNSASRKGEPFQALVESKGYLPNAVARFCTVELKIRVMRDFARSRMKRIRRRRMWVEAPLTAFHTDPYLGEGRHQHTWTVRVYYPAKPFKDGRALEVALVETLAGWQGADLPNGLFAAEDIAATLLRLIGAGQPLGVEVSRPDGPGGDAWWN